MTETSIIFRRRAKELRDLASTISPMLRADLIKVAVEWERLADRAEKGARPAPENQDP